MEQGQTQMGERFAVKVGNGAVQLTSGETEGVVHVGDEDIPFSFATFDTDAFHVILGNDFFEANPHMKYLSLQAPRHLLVPRHWHLVEVPLKEDTTPKPSVQIIQGLWVNLGADMKLEGADQNEADGHQAKSSDCGGEDVQEGPQVYPELHTRRAREQRG